MSVAGYSYKADNYCVHCVIKEVCKDYGLNEPEDCMSYEDELSILASQIKSGIDRYDEATYDSGEFPKVIFTHQIEDTEHCCKCHDEL